MAGMNTNERGLAGRIGIAFAQAVGIGMLSGLVGCCGIMFLVRNSSDGQAGMGAFFGGIYIALLAGLITFVTSLVRSRKSIG
jgi:hypothetical protein